MKIGDNPPTIPPAPGGPETAEEPAAKPGASEFAAQVDAAAPEPPAPWGAPAASGDLGAIAADVDAGRISAPEAVARVVDQVLAAQLPPDASPELRARVRALVEASLQHDPLLASLVKRLGGGT